MRRDIDRSGLMDSSLNTEKGLGREGKVRVEVSRGLVCFYRETEWGHHEEAGGSC